MPVLDLLESPSRYYRCFEQNETVGDAILGDSRVDVDRQQGQQALHLPAVCQGACVNERHSVGTWMLSSRAHPGCRPLGVFLAALLL